MPCSPEPQLPFSPMEWMGEEPHPRRISSVTSCWERSQGLAPGMTKNGAGEEPMLWNLSRTIVTGSILMMAGVPVRAVAGDLELPVVQSRDLARVAPAVPLGGRVMLQDVRVVDTGEPAAFVLQRFQVFAAGAEITVHGDHGEEVRPAPDNAYFRGEVADRPGSRVFLAVLEDGTAQGVVTEVFWHTGGQPSLFA